MNAILKYRRAAVVVVSIILAVALQTTLFLRLRPFDAAPALVMLVVIAFARHLPAEFALFGGFSAGLLEDLLSQSALGLWALTLTTVAYFVVRIRDRLEDSCAIFSCPLSTTWPSPAWFCRSSLGPWECATSRTRTRYETRMAPGCDRRSNGRILWRSSAAPLVSPGHRCHDFTRCGL